jgi:hypothetical protein
MEIDIKRAALSVEGLFERPAFALSRDSSEVVEGIWHKFSSRYRLSPADFQVMTGSTLGDYGIRIGVFQNAKIDFKFDSFVCNFERLLKSDFDVAYELINLAGTACQVYLQSDRFEVISVTLSLWFSDPCRPNHTFLPPVLFSEVPSFSNTQHQRYYSGHLLDRDQSWRIDYMFEPSSVDPIDVYMRVIFRQLKVPLAEFPVIRDRVATLVDSVLDIARAHQ